MNALDHLKSLIANSNFDEAALKVQELQGSTDPSEETLSFLRSLLFHEDDELRQTVVTTLGRLKDLPSVPLMAKLYAKWMDPFDHDYIFDAFREMGDSAVLNLTAVAKTTTVPEERHAAVWGLGQMGGAAVPVLLDMLEEGGDDVIPAMVNTYDPRCAPALLEVIKTRDNDTALQAAHSFCNCCDASCSVLVPEILALLRGSKIELRLELIEALGRIGDERAIPGLARCLKQGGSNVEAAAEALVELETEGALNALWTGLSSGKVKEEGRGIILSAVLSHPRSIDGDKTRALRTALESCKERYQAIDLFIEAQSHDCCVRVAREYAEAPEPALRLAVASVLSEAESEAARQHARYAFENGDDEVRVDCIWLLLELGDAESLRSAARDSSMRVRLEVAQGLGFSSGLPRSVCLKILAGFCNDRSLKVKEAALSSIFFRNEDRDNEKRLAYEAPFLFSKSGKPCDFIISEFHHADGRIEYSTLSDEIAALEHPEARAIIARWRSAGGKRATSYHSSSTNTTLKP